MKLDYMMVRDLLLISGFLNLVLILKFIMARMAFKDFEKNIMLETGITFKTKESYMEICDELWIDHGFKREKYDGR